MRSTAVDAAKAARPTLAGKRWLRAYVNGCRYQFCEVTTPPALVGAAFRTIAARLHAGHGMTLLGLAEAGSGRVRLNPVDTLLARGDMLLAIAPSRRKLGDAVARVAHTMASQGGWGSGPAGAGAHDTVDLAEPLRWVGGWSRRRFAKQVSAPSERGDGEERVPAAPGAPGSATDVAATECITCPRYASDTDSDSVDEDRTHRPLPGTNDAASVRGESQTAQPQGPGLNPTQASSGTVLGGHIIVAGAEESFLPFIQTLRRCSNDRSMPIVILHPSRPPSDLLSAGARDSLGRVLWVAGSPSDPEALMTAGSACARALVFLSGLSRPAPSAQATGATTGVRMCVWCEGRQGRERDRGMDVCLPPPQRERRSLCRCATVLPHLDSTAPTSKHTTCPSPRCPQAPR